MLLSISSAGTSLQCLTPSKYSALFNKLMNKIKLSKSRCKHLYYLHFYLLYYLIYYLYYLILRPKHKEL